MRHAGHFAGGTADIGRPRFLGCSPGASGTGAMSTSPVVWARTQSQKGPEGQCVYAGSVHDFLPSLGGAMERIHAAAAASFSMGCMYASVSPIEDWQKICQSILARRWWLPRCWVSLKPRRRRVLDHARRHDHEDTRIWCSRSRNCQTWAENITAPHPHTKNSLVLIKGPQLIVGMRWNHARNFF